MTAPAKKLRLAFMGTPEFAVPVLRAILDDGHDVVAVYTQPPRPKGRGHQLTKSPVHELAEARGLPVHTPSSLRKSPDAQAEFAALDLDVCVVAAYGLILPASVLKAPRLGCLNTHASILPRWRGASPIQHAIWHDDAQSGVTIMQMEEGLDTGPMIRVGTTPITPTTTTQQLHDALSEIGARLIVDVLAELANKGQVTANPQPEDGITYAPLLKKEDGRIDWTLPASDLDCQIRALNPWPGTYAILDKTGAVFKILSAHIDDGVTGNAPGTILNRTGGVVCGDGQVLTLDQIQVPSGKKISMIDAMNGGYFQPGQILPPS